MVSVWFKLLKVLGGKVGIKRRFRTLLLGCGKGVGEGWDCQGAEGGVKVRLVGEVEEGEGGRTPMATS